jgi:hypothetical protein
MVVRVAFAFGVWALSCTPRAPFGDDRSPADAATPPAEPDAALDLAPGEARNLGPYECEDLPGSGYPCQSIDDYSRFVVDERRHQLLWFGGGEHATPRTDVAVFDLHTWQWGSAYPPTACADMTPDNADLVRGAWKTTGHPMSRQTYDMLVLAENTGELVMLTYNSPGSDCSGWPPVAPDLDDVPGRIAHYAPDARKWRFSAAPANLWAPDSSAEYDPVSGLVVVLSEKGLWTYDPRSEAIVQRMAIDSNARLGYSAELVYFPPADRFYQFTRPGLVFEIVPVRNDWAATRITEITDATGSPPAMDAKGWAYDAGRRNIGGGVRDGTFYTFDPATHGWTSRRLSGGAGNVAFFTLAYAAPEGVFVFVTDYDSGYSTWVYRP